MNQGAENTGSIGIFTIDAGLVVQVWDEAMSTMTGIMPEDATGKHLTELIPDLESRGLLTRFERVRDLGTIEVLAAVFHRYLVRCEPHFPSRHFSEMRQLVTISPLLSENAASGVMVMVEDVTWRLERERDITAQLRDPDDNVRLDAAKQIVNGSGPLSPETADTIVGALGDRNWRVRRKLVEGLSKRIAPESVGLLLKAFRDGHLDFGILNSALRVLQSASSADTATSLIGFLQSEDSDLRIQAALALGEVNEPMVQAALLRALDDQDPNVRYHAIEALGKLKARSAVGQLLSVVKSRDFFLAYPALEALARIGGDGIAGSVRPLLEDEVLAEPACQTLGATGGIEIVEPALAALEAGRISPSAAAAALCSLFDRMDSDTSAAKVAEAVKRLVGANGTRAVAAAIPAGQTPETGKLIRLAGWIDDPEIRKALASMIGDDVHHDSAVAALSSHGDAAVDHFVAALDSEDRNVRSSAARALAEFDSHSAVEALIAALDSDDETAALAARSLGRSANSTAFDALVELLSTDRKALQMQAVQALRALSRSEMAPRLCSLLGNQKDAQVREALIRIMGGLDTEDCVAAVIAACEDEAPLVRSAAVEQLPNLSTRDVLPLFEKALTDSDPRVRASAARTLGLVGGSGSTLLLRTALRDDDAWTRYFAVRSLSGLGDTSSEEMLRTLSEEDSAEQVRAAAAEAISQR